MLGISYGTLHLVLPHRRIEGADDPFAIRLFPGWGTYVAYPCYAIAGITSAVIFALLTYLVEDLRLNQMTQGFVPVLCLGTILLMSFFLLCLVYRVALLDVHETPLLILTQRLARILCLNLFESVEPVIYRATLGAHELRRLGIDLTTMKQMLVHIEDREFYRHSGVSIRGLLRLMLATVRLRSRSGGSTITQQLVRTLFIPDYSKILRRKLAEIFLALWLTKVVRKSDQLDMYLAAVRFEEKVHGLAAAMRHFFGNPIMTPSKAEAFFLIERVSNVRSRLLFEKIDQMLRAAVSAQVIARSDAQAVVGLYERMVSTRLIHDPEMVGIKRLKHAWNSPL